jgi:hypothetical protein
VLRFRDPEGTGLGGGPVKGGGTVERRVVGPPLIDGLIATWRWGATDDPRALEGTRDGRDRHVRRMA